MKKDIGSFTTVLENTADLRCEAFDKDVIGKAKQELEDSKIDYETEKSEALQNLMMQKQLYIIRKKNIQIRFQMHNRNLTQPKSR